MDAVALAHTPSRPGWMCEPCDAPWPCDPARIELRERYVDDPVGLAVYLASQLTMAAREAPASLPDELFERFILWALPRQP